jgi:hypothetical protein
MNSEQLLNAYEAVAFVCTTYPRAAIWDGDVVTVLDGASMKALFLHHFRGQTKRPEANLQAHFEKLERSAEWFAEGTRFRPKTASALRVFGSISASHIVSRVSPSVCLIVILMIM